MINITGYNGMTFFQPNDIEDLWIRLTGLDPVSVEEMTEHGLVPVEYSDRLTCSMKDGEIYKSYLIKTL